MDSISSNLRQANLIQLENIDPLDCLSSIFRFPHSIPLVSVCFSLKISWRDGL